MHDKINKTFIHFLFSDICLNSEVLGLGTSTNLCGIPRCLYHAPEDRNLWQSFTRLSTRPASITTESRGRDTWMGSWSKDCHCTIKCHLGPAQLPPVAACAGVGGGQAWVLGDHLLSDPWQVKCASQYATCFSIWMILKNFHNWTLNWITFHFITVLSFLASSTILRRSSLFFPRAVRVTVSQGTPPITST